MRKSIIKESLDLALRHVKDDFHDHWVDLYTEGLEDYDEYLKALKDLDGPERLSEEDAEDELVVLYRAILKAQRELE